MKLLDEEEYQLDQEIVLLQQELLKATADEKNYLIAEKKIQDRKKIDDEFKQSK